jgi:hypothetical protein
VVVVVHSTTRQQSWRQLRQGDTPGHCAGGIERNHASHAAFTQSVKYSKTTSARVLLALDR